MKTDSEIRFWSQIVKPDSKVSTSHLTVGWQMQNEILRLKSFFLDNKVISLVI